MVDLLSEKKVVMVFKSLGLNRGGLTKAVIARANAFSEIGYDVSIITYTYQPDFHKIVKALVDGGVLSEKVKISNFFDDILGFYKSNRRIWRRIKLTVNKIIVKILYKKTVRSKGEYRLYRNGLYIKFLKTTGRGLPLLVDYMNHARQRVKRREFDHTYSLRKEINYDAPSNSPRLERFFGRSGRCRMTVWIDSDGKSKGKTIIYGKKLKEYSSLRVAQKQWVSEKTLNSNYVFCDSRNTDDLVGENKNVTAKLIAVIHNNHLKIPDDPFSEIKPDYEIIFSNYNYDAWIFLTERQKSDVLQRHSLDGLVSVVPHFHEKPENEKETIARRRNEICLIGRLEAQKDIGSAIDAMKLVVEEVPDAVLRVFGKGSKKNELKSQITELGLEDSVFLEGYTSDPNKILARSGCMVLTSIFEGFGLVCMESLMAGTPVVAFNCNYGPSDIISDGENGFIVEGRCPKRLADQLVNVLCMDELEYDRLVDNAIKTRDRFSKAKYIERWEAILEDLSR